MEQQRIEVVGKPTVSVGGYVFIHQQNKLKAFLIINLGF